MSEEAEILDLEQRRCAAISTPDARALNELLADDYVHIFGNGRVSDKPGYVRSIVEFPRTPVRGDLTVRVYGDTAIITGDVLNRVKQPDGSMKATKAIATQVVHRRHGRWTFVSCQMTVHAGNQD